MYYGEQGEASGINSFCMFRLNAALRFGVLTCALAVGVSVALPLSASAATNLIQNPSFETTSGSAPANWTATYWGSPAPTFTYPVAGHTGNAAMVTFASNSSGDARWAHDPVSVTPGTTYTYSNWYKSNVATQVDIAYISASGAITWGWLADVPSSNDSWQQVTASVTIPSNIAQVVVFHLLDKQGSLTVDDFSLSDGTEPPPPPPPAAPTLTFTATPTSITSGESSTLTWESSDADTCTASNGWAGSKALSGSESVSPTDTQTYSLDCSGEGGSVHKEVTVTVGSVPPPPPEAPTLTLSASPTSITAGQQSTLSWTSTNADTCTAMGGWSGSKALSGDQTVTPSATATYTLSCSGAGGDVSKQVTVTVTATPPPPTDGFSEGMVSITFDDSWLSQYTNALPVLEDAGLKGTFYLTTEPIQRGWDDFMTPGQVQDIAQKGHEIAGHTVTHVDLTRIGRSRVNREIRNSKTYLQNLTGAVVTSFAYPYGSLNNTIKSLLQNAGYSSARGVDEESQNTSTTDKYELKSSCIETSHSMAQIKSEIDKAKANNQWYILCIHEVKNGGDQYTMTPARFEEIVDYITSTGIKVVTVEEGRALMSN